MISNPEPFKLLKDKISVQKYINFISPYQNTIYFSEKGYRVLFFLCIIFVCPRWDVPVTWVTDISSEPTLRWLSRDEAMLEINLPEGTDWVKFNVGQFGYYR